MKAIFTSILQILHVSNVLVSATGSTRQKTIVCPQVTLSPLGSAAIVDEIHHLECQRNISHEKKELIALQEKAELVANDFYKDFQTLIQTTLKACTHSHRELTKPETAQTRLRLNRWVPILFDSPTNRYISAGKNFLVGLGPLEAKARELELMIKQDVGGHAIVLSSLCDGTRSPCTGGILGAVHSECSLVEKACTDVQEPGEIIKIAQAWAMLASQLAQERINLSSTWSLVKDAQQDDKMTGEWAANVIERWIELLGHLSWRAELGGVGLSIS